MITFRNAFLIGAIFIILKGLLVGFGVDLPSRLGYNIDNTSFYALKSVGFGILLILIAINLFPKEQKKK